MVDTLPIPRENGNRRMLAVDPGERHIGLAVSDPSGTVGRPLSVLRHVSLKVDAASIATIARENDVTLIIVGQALDSEGRVGPAARKAGRLVDALRTQIDTPVILWDESGTTQSARNTLLEMGVSRIRRSGHHDALAAVLILKDYIESNLEDG
jgi:putative Holliday junction resolvase